MAENGILDYQGMNQAIYRGATSNIVVDTQSMSIEIGAGNTSHTSNLHFECNHDANVASIKLNSNVVTEFSRSKKLIKYPRVAMTQNDESGTSGYVASASATNPNRDPYRAFDNVLYSSWHEPVYQSNPYPNIDGAYTGGSGTVYDTNGYRGEYLQIQLPEKIKLYNYSISNRADAGLEGRQPKDAKIFASNDGNTWIDIHTHSDGGGTYDIAGETRSFQLDNITETHYKYYRLVINSIIQGGISDTANISQWQLFGIPEYDPEADGTDVTVKSYPNVPNTDWLEVYYDAKGLTSISGTVADLAGGDQDASVYGVTLDTTNEAFVFDGSSYLETDIPQITTGVWPFTMSFWFKVNAHIGGTWNYLAHLGIRGTNGDSTLVGLQNDQISITTWGDSKINSGVVATPGVWYHVTSTWPGGAFYDNAKLYINAVSYGDVDNIRVEVDPLSFPTSGNKLTLGKQMNTTSDYFNGSIANFRLFNRALTPDEIYQLYAYQKKYFGHGDLGMTLKAGRLGIGTSEPRAALDVQGDIHGGCPVFFHATRTSHAESTSLQGFDPLVWQFTRNNKGGGYSTITGKFTAPINGYYEFAYGGMSLSATKTFELIPKLNNVDYPGPVVYTSPSNGTHRFASCNAIVYMNAGDTWHLRMPSGDQAMYGAGNHYNFFTGKYLSN